MSIQLVAVIGAGPAGRAFAGRCAASGFDVVLEDVMPSNLRRAQDEYAEYAELTSATGAGSLRYALTVEDAVRCADVVVDFVPDELESKLEIFSLVDRMAPPHTVLCTPTRTLSITDLASCTYRAGLCFGLRATCDTIFESPIEVLRSKFSDGAAVINVSAFLTRLGVSFRVCDDVEEPMLVKNVR